MLVLTVQTQEEADQLKRRLINVGEDIYQDHEADDEGLVTMMEE